MQNESSYGNGFFMIIKGAGLALALSLLFTVIFACILKVTGGEGAFVYPVTQVLKVLAVAIGSIAFVRGEKGWLKGVGIGLAFTALSYLAFSALGGDFSVSWLIVFELFITCLASALGGILAVNCKK
jgi:putative membrane protein (TIGR04086 family)